MQYYPRVQYRGGRKQSWSGTRHYLALRAMSLLHSLSDPRPHKDIAKETIKNITKAVKKEKLHRAAGLGAAKKEEAK